LENAAKLAEDLRQLIEESPVETVGICTASFGVAQARENDSIETLIKRADEALYKAKDSGRNCVYISES
jgi:diguanylate cyclase (GGDEF)-like protein